MGSGKNYKEPGSTSHAIPIAGEDTPLLGNAPQSSQLKTLANVFIAIVGSGVLGLPYTFMKSGWLLGIIVMFSIAALTYYCMLLLVAIRRKLESLNGCSKINSFGDLGFIVCGSFGRLSVDIMIILSQAGFCVGYMIYVSNTLAYLFNTTSGTDIFYGLTPNKWYLWGSLPFQLGLNAIPSLTLLAPLSIFADVVQIGAMAVVMVKDVMVYVQNRPEVTLFGGWGVFFYCVGVSTYAFEGIGMVIPLESEADDKNKFGVILGLSMGIIALIYGLFGVMGYMAFGDETRDIITTNIGTGFISSVVQLGLVINLFFTFPLMMNPVYEVLERRCTQGSYSLWLRCLVVVLVVFSAMLVPNFADFLSLVGSSVCVALGFVFPALFHLIVFKHEMNWFKLSLDVVIMIVGVVIAVTGTWTTLAEIIGADEA